MHDPWQSRTLEPGRHSVPVLDADNFSHALIADTARNLLDSDAQNVRGVDLGKAIQSKLAA